MTVTSASQSVVSVAKKPSRPAAFDPYLGCVCADTWWDLGKLIAHRDDAAWLEKQVPRWVADLHADYVGHITVDAVAEFARTIFGLLRRRFRHQPIAAEANLITAPMREPGDYFRDDDERGPYLDFTETLEQFWAVEYATVLEELLRPELSDKKDQRGWLNAVDECAECHEFFVKQRRDQIFDSAKCRTKFANRDAYLSRRGRRAGGRH
jgi:hypothetical protein